MTDPSQPDPPSRRPSIWDNYVTLFVVLVALLMVFSFVGDRSVTSLLAVVLLVVAIIISYRASEASATVVTRVTIGAVVLGSILAATLFSSGDLVDGITTLGLAVIIGSGPLVILRFVFNQSRVTMNQVMGALSAYIEIGFFFGLLYRAVDDFATEQFFAQTTDPQAWEFVYFSFITMTTVGYGDLSPALRVGQGFVILEVLLGSIFLVVLVARLVSTLGTERGLSESNPGDSPES